MNAILGVPLATIGLVALLVGILALFKGTVGSFAKGLIGWMPFSPKMAAIVTILIGVLLGGWGAAIALIPSDVASITSVNANTVAAKSALTCTLGVITKAVANDNVTFRADNSNSQKYYADVKYDSEDAGINGTLTCSRSDGTKSETQDCTIVGSSFRSETSTTDSNTYYIIENAAGKSKIDGLAYQQTAYLKDGAIATTSSDREKTSLTFTGGDTPQSSETLGFYFKLPNTPFTYLNNQTSNDVKINCGGSQVFDIVVTKTSA
jgi:hypothetical protein